MKRDLFFQGLLIALLVLGFAACDIDGDTGGSNTGGNPQPRATFVSETNSGTVTIVVYGENPVRAARSGDFYVILLNGNVIGRGTITVSSNTWTFQPTFGATTSFSGNLTGGNLNVPNIPSAQGPIIGFDARESEEPGGQPGEQPGEQPGVNNVNVVGYWDSVWVYPGVGVKVSESINFRADGTLIHTISWEDGPEGDESGFDTVPGTYTVSGNNINMVFLDDFWGNVSVTVVNNSFTFFPPGDSQSRLFTRR